MMTQGISEINERVKRESAFIYPLISHIHKVMVGQSALIERLLIGLFANGHILIEGVPGLAKTLAVKLLADSFNTSFQRIQFTPDLLPADLIGTLVYNPKEGTFSTKKGPIFAHIILADEINRAPAKVQSALLEAMQERQVTIGRDTFPMEQPFLVLATQNPIEQEGTYPLPEAQVDRFMLKVSMGYPSKEEEHEIIKRMSVTTPKEAVEPIASADDIFKARDAVDAVYMDEKLASYIVDIVSATRYPQDYGLDETAGLIHYGASPRAGIYLTRAAKALAFIRARGYVTPQDIKDIGMDVLRHRIIVTYEAEAEEITSEDIVRRIFDEIKVP